MESINYFWQTHCERELIMFAIAVFQATLTQMYSQCQRYYQVFQAANDWLDDAHEILQLTGNGLDVESAEESLKNHMEFFSTEDQFHSNLEELQGLVANLDPLIKPSGKEDLAQKMASLEEKSQGTIQESHIQLDLLQRYWICLVLYILVKWIFTWKIGIY